MSAWCILLLLLLLLLLKTVAFNAPTRIHTHFAMLNVDTIRHNCLSAGWTYVAIAVRKDIGIFKGKLITGLLP
jgi:hypothetical protein